MPNNAYFMEWWRGGNVKLPPVNIATMMQPTDVLCVRLLLVGVLYTGAARARDLGVSGKDTDLGGRNTFWASHARRLASKARRSPSRADLDSSRPLFSVANRSRAARIASICLSAASLAFGERRGG